MYQVEVRQISRLWINVFYSHYFFSCDCMLESHLKFTAPALPAESVVWTLNELLHCTWASSDYLLQCFEITEFIV